MTAVHPESYTVVEQIATSLETISHTKLLRGRNYSSRSIASQLSAGAFTVADILAELKKPGRDPRDKFVAPGLPRARTRTR